MNRSFFYLNELHALREKLARASRDGTRLGRVWDSVVRRARTAPEDYPWFTPLVALIGGEPADIDGNDRIKLSRRVMLEDEARDRHADAVHARVVDEGPPLKQDDQAAWLAMLDAELPEGTAEALLQAGRVRLPGGPRLFPR